MQVLTGTSVMIADSVLIFCAYSLVIARFWFRLINQRLGFTLSDILLLIACIELLAILCIFIKEHEMGAMDEGFEMNRDMLKLSFSTVLLYDSSLYVLKFSMITFFHTIIPRGKSKTRTALYISAVITLIFWFTALLLAMFWCGADISKLFHVPEQGQCTFWDTRLFQIDWAMNVVSDFMILLLPFPLLSKLILSKRQIAALAVTFGLGAITMVVSIFRFVTVWKHKFQPLYVWSVAEISTGIMVVSLPALRPLLRRVGSGSTDSKRRNSSRIGPIQDNPEPRPASMRLSKYEHRSRNGDPPDGFHYSYETGSLGSDVELHGGLRSDTHSKTETIAVYTDAAEVLDHHVDEENPAHRTHELKSWVQRTRQNG